MLVEKRVNIVCVYVALKSQIFWKHLRDSPNLNVLWAIPYERLISKFCSMNKLFHSYNTCILNIFFSQTLLHHTGSYFFLQVLDNFFTLRWIGSGGPINWPLRFPDLSLLTTKSMNKVSNDEKLRLRYYAALSNITRVWFEFDWLNDGSHVDIFN